MSKKIVCDLDGTICTQENSDTYHLAKPKQEMIDVLWKCLRKGYHITIFTARGMNTCGGDVEQIEEKYGEMTRNWLAWHGVPFHALKFGKPAGDYYIDDKGFNPEDFIEVADDIL